MMRLPYQLKTLFLEWLQRELPERASHIETLVREVRGGNLSDPRFGSRMRGQGPHAETIQTLFRVHRKRLGLDKPLPELSAASFRRPQREGDQLPLFS
jgi:hypothetical protein